MQESITNEHELTFLIDRLSHKLWIDWLIFKSVAPMSRKEVHVQMGERVAVNLVVDLHGPCACRDGCRHSARVPHERGCSNIRKVMQLYGMEFRDKANISWERCSFRHRHPGHLKFRDNVQWHPPPTNRATNS